MINCQMIFTLTFQPSYWCGSKRNMINTYTEENSITSTYFERDPSGSKVGISIQHLRKVRPRLASIIYVFVCINHVSCLFQGAHQLKTQILPVSLTCL